MVLYDISGTCNRKIKCVECIVKQTFPSFLTGSLTVTVCAISFHIPGVFIYNVSSCYLGDHSILVFITINDRQISMQLICYNVYFELYILFPLFSVIWLQKVKDKV